MTIAITGATGHLGHLAISHLKQLVDPQGIVALVRNVDKGAVFEAEGLDVRKFDYTEPVANLSAALEGVERLLLISGNELEQRAAQHQAVIDAATDAGVAFVAYTSLLHGEQTDNPIAAEHLATEAALAAAPFDVALLRNGWYSENYLPAAQQAIEQGTLLTSAGDGRVASASRSDYAEAAAKIVAEGTPGTFELSGDTAWDFDTLVTTINEITGANITLTQVTADEQRSILSDAGLPDEVVNVLVGFDQAIAHGDLAYTSDNLRTLIGHSTTPLKETLAAGLSA